MTLEEMCEELRKRPGRGGKCIKETTVQKYLETVSSVLEDAKKNDIIPFNPAHRVRKKHFEKEVQHIPQKYEMSKLMRTIQNEPILYRAYYTNASLLIAQGVDVRTVASLLGHAQASTTLDIYAHAFDKNKRKAQEKLGKAIGL